MYKIYKILFLSLHTHTLEKKLARINNKSLKYSKSFNIFLKRKKRNLEKKMEIRVNLMKIATNLG